MAELLSMGELLIDFTPSGKTEDGRILFAENPGGAPANVAVQATRAGVSAGFLGCVGKDMFGDFLAETLRECGVETRGLTQTQEYSTSLAFVQLSDTGDRDFSFYRNPGADTRLSYEKIDFSLLEECKLVCFGSLLLTAEPSRSCVPKLVDYARKHGSITAYDPNWRPPLWKDKAIGVKEMRSLVPLADIMKISEEEVLLLTEKEAVEDGARELLAQGVSVVVATLGARGCAVFTDEFSFSLPTYDTRVKDTTGSGDSFFGALLSKIVKCGKKPKELSENELLEFVDFANAAGAICATKSGAIPAMPTLFEIEDCQRNVPKLIV